jgi:hypothetical protein
VWILNVHLYQQHSPLLFQFISHPDMAVQSNICVNSSLHAFNHSTQLKMYENENIPGTYSKTWRVHTCLTLEHTFSTHVLHASSYLVSSGIHVLLLQNSFPSHMNNFPPPVKIRKKFLIYKMNTKGLQTKWLLQLDKLTMTYMSSRLFTLRSSICLSLYLRKELPYVKFLIGV